MPDGWIRGTLRDQLDLCRNGLVCRQDADPVEGLPITRIETISEGKINWHRVGYVSREDVKPQYLLRRGDILLSHINSIKHIGKVAQKTDDRPLLHGMNLMVLRFAQHLDPGFAFATMASHRTKAYMESRAKKAVNQASINSQDIYALPILLPPLSEQRVIAAVLDSIDEAIKRTEAVIAATERLRDALLHELLTRGVRGWHSEWKDVPGIGTLPACWEVVRLGEIATLQRGMDLPSDKRLPGDVPVYGANGIHGVHNSSPIDGPGVITGRSGSMGLVHYTESSYWPLNTTLYVKDFHGNNERFVYYFLSGMGLERFAASTGVPSLNRNFVHPIRVSIPPLAEQLTIVAVLDSVEEAAERGREESDVLQSLKAAASDALLTGHVRVSV